MIFDSIFAFFVEHAISIISGITLIAVDGSLLQNYFNVVDYILENASLLGLFIRPSTLVKVSFTALAIYNFEYIYNTAVWVKNRFKFN